MGCEPAERVGEDAIHLCYFKHALLAGHVLQFEALKLSFGCLLIFADCCSKVPLHQINSIMVPTNFSMHSTL